MRPAQPPAGGDGRWLRSSSRSPRAPSASAAACSSRCARACSRSRRSPRRSRSRASRSCRCCSLTVAPWAAGRLVRSRRELIDALAERNRQLEAEREAVAALAVRRERARIARELHDIVAHHLAVMVIQAGAGRLAAPDGGARFAGIRDAGTRGAGRARPPRRAAADRGRRAAAHARQPARPGAGGRAPARLRAAARGRARRARGRGRRVPGDPGGAHQRDEARRGIGGARCASRSARGALEIDVRDDGAVAPSPLSASGLGSASRACASASRRSAGCSTPGRGRTVAGGCRRGSRWGSARPRVPPGDDGKLPSRGDDAGARRRLTAWHGTHRSSPHRRAARLLRPRRARAASSPISSSGP